MPAVPMYKSNASSVQAEQEAHRYPNEWLENLTAFVDPPIISLDVVQTCYWNMVGSVTEYVLPCEES